jgi:uncharacterized protein YrrD
MRVAEVISRKVLDLESASVVGQVHDAILDSTARVIVGFSLRGVPDRSDWLAWENIVSIGPDAVTVESVRMLTEPPSLGRLIFGDDVVGGRALSDHGLLLSPIAEIEFDPKSGQVITLTLADGRIVAAADLLGSGTYATMLRDQPRDMAN